MSGKASRDKGKRGELARIKEARAKLKHWAVSNRGMQARGGSETADFFITGSGLRLHCESKNMARPNVWSAIDQARRDKSPHDYALAVVHRTRVVEDGRQVHGETLAVMDWSEFLDLIDALLESTLDSE